MAKGIGFTGTQKGMTEAQILKIHDLLPLLMIKYSKDLHHGDCIGADAQIHRLGRSAQCFIYIHPPNEPNKRAWCQGDVMLDPKGYLARNHDIVEETDVLIATPKGFNEEQRSGTWATIRYARKLGREIYIIYPDGTTRHET